MPRNPRDQMPPPDKRILVAVALILAALALGRSSRGFRLRFNGCRTYIGHRARHTGTV
jgi:hypothetical protein